VTHPKKSENKKEKVTVANPCNMIRAKLSWPLVLEYRENSFETEANP